MTRRQEVRAVMPPWAWWTLAGTTAIVALPLVGWLLYALARSVPATLVEFVMPRIWP